MNGVDIQGGQDVLPLKFDLEILSSTCIKCKKPWPRVAFVGEVSFFLLSYFYHYMYYAKFIKTVFF